MLKAVVSLLAILLSAPRIEKEIQLWKEQLDYIKFTVYDEPVAQGRPLGSIRNGKVHMRDPAKSKYFKQYVALVASQHRPETIITGPVSMDVKVYRPMPKSVSNS